MDPLQYSTPPPWSLRWSPYDGPPLMVIFIGKYSVEIFYYGFFYAITYYCYVYHLFRYVYFLSNSTIIYLNACNGNCNTHCNFICLYVYVVLRDLAYSLCLYIRSSCITTFFFLTLPSNDYKAFKQ